MEQRARTRFFDVRSYYPAFVGATTEKAAVTERIARETSWLDRRLPVLRVFEAGMGDATVLAGAMRHLKGTHPRVPWLVVGKEISPENVVLGLAVLPDRFDEHPDLVFVVTNMTDRAAPDLQPGLEGSPVSWRRTALRGSTTAEFSRQLSGSGDTGLLCHDADDEDSVFRYGMRLRRADPRGDRTPRPRVVRQRELRHLPEAAMRAGES